MGSTQYDDIVESYNKIYNDITSMPAAQFEEAQVHDAVTSHDYLSIKGKRVLDLACGSGHYSRRFLEWGARSVVGVDISSQMVGEARAAAVKAGLVDDENVLRYVVGDASQDLDLSAYGAPFDVVAGTWLLNYAPDAKAMEGMWRAIAQNLVLGGVFVGLTISPPLCGREELTRALEGEWAKYGTSGRVKSEVQDGFEVHIVLGLPGTQQAEFNNFYLRNEVFEKTAKSGGLTGGLEWRPVVLSEDLRKQFPTGYWNEALLNPHCRICVAWR